jgi:H+/Cl- antiporter ClcA
MNINDKKNIANVEQIPLLIYMFKWLGLALLVGVLVGCASAFFLLCLGDKIIFGSFFFYPWADSLLVWFIPFPIALLASMGFIAVFSGATNTPIACTNMGIELFGIGSCVYIGLTCVVAYLFSSHTGIYSSQVIGSPKHILFRELKSKTLQNIESRKT